MADRRAHDGQSPARGCAPDGHSGPDQSAGFAATKASGYAG
ncbi:MAG: hypothetical protein WCY98_11600 [Castellaniella sp.]